MSCSICDPTLWAGSLVLMYAMRRIFNSRHRSLLGKVVVVTGCDSGFGELTAQKFAALGCTVYAGVLLAESKKRFEQMAISNLKPFLLDVTKPESIAAMKATLLKDNASLKIDVLVNNAYTPPPPLPPPLVVTHAAASRRDGSSNSRPWRNTGRSWRSTSSASSR